MQPLNEENGPERLNTLDASGVWDAVVRPLPLFIRRGIRSFKGGTPFGLLRNRILRNGILSAFLIGGGVVLTDQNRAVGTAFASMTAKVGFEVSNLVVNGNQHLSKDDVSLILSNTLGRTMFGLDVEVVRDRLSDNRWIAAATVKKAYPDTLVIDVVEREPVALWKSGETLIVISREGIAIDEAAPQHMHLPQVVGAGANSVASQFLSAIAKFPELVARSDAYVRVAERRWDVVIDDGPKVMLPAKDWQDALSSLNVLQAEKAILDRDVTQIDMRLPDRLVLRLEPDAADIRRTTIEESLKRDWHKS